MSVEHGLARRDVIERRVRAIRGTLPTKARGELDTTMSRIYAQLEQRSARTRGIAVFARGGEAPYFRALEFRVPLPELVILSRSSVGWGACFATPVRAGRDAELGDRRGRVAGVEQRSQ
jgi:hypothetical protein